MLKVQRKIERKKMFKNLFKSGQNPTQSAGIPWENLNSITQLEEIKNHSQSQKVLIFKHSTRCSISFSALNRLERTWQQEEMENVKAYLLDLIQFRNVSNQVAEEFGVPHQSPQVLVINQGNVIYDDSHMGIMYDELKEVIQKG